MAETVGSSCCRGFGDFWGLSTFTCINLYMIIYTSHIDCTKKRKCATGIASTFFVNFMVFRGDQDFFASPFTKWTFVFLRVFFVPSSHSAYMFAHARFPIM